MASLTQRGNWNENVSSFCSTEHLRGSHDGFFCCFFLKPLCSQEYYAPRHLAFVHFIGDTVWSPLPANPPLRSYWSPLRCAPTGQRRCQGWLRFSHREEQLQGQNIRPGRRRRRRKEPFHPGQTTHNRKCCQDMKKCFISHLFHMCVHYS